MLPGQDWVWKVHGDHSSWHGAKMLKNINWRKGGLYPQSVIAFHSMQETMICHHCSTLM